MQEKMHPGALDVVKWVLFDERTEVYNTTPALAQLFRTATDTR